MASTLSVEFPRTLDAPAQARDALDTLDSSLPADVIPDLRLLVTELMTNAVKYGGEGPVKLIVSNDETRLRAEIVDQGTGFTPIARDGNLSRPGGWGLHLVEQLTDDWGTYEGSTHVWFEIDLTRPRPHDLAA